MEDRKRMLDKEKQPTEEEMLDFIGKRAEKVWRKLKQFLAENYDMTPETLFYGKKYGWTIRYRKSGRTLCSLFPEEGGFTFHIVLGKREVVKFEGVREEWSPDIRELFDTTKQLHDGRWLWINQPDVGNLRDLERLLMIKRRPKKNIP
jgi:hypothetical protein